MKTKANTEHLHKYITEQDTASYTPVEQATWRFIMRQLKTFLSKHAHPFYVEGLEKAGIQVNYIPSIKEMSESLKDYDWNTVPVSGFLPPAAFLEMQSLGFLPIAKEIRTVDHIPYTPAPDIVHEAAGHAPYLAHPDFTKYLHTYADVANKAIISSEDFYVYSAIRKLSDVKETPDASKEEIQQAEKELEAAVSGVSYVSEAAKASRLYWWTAEYGLVGDLQNPKIYGAGILSSIGEAKNCLKPEVTKIPLSLNCLDYAFDITEQQPQLFVAKDFHQLSDVLEEMSNTFSYKRGGKYGIEEAIRAKTVNTVELDSGLQISGVFETYKSQSDEILYIKTNSPTQLAVKRQELKGHDKNYHSHGYSTILGNWKGVKTSPKNLNTSELENLNISPGKNCQLEFTSGVKLSGKVVSYLHQDGNLVLLSFEDCSVTFGEDILFAPEWGTFDLGVGNEITSVFGGPADFSAYGDTEDFEAVHITKPKPTARDLEIYALYTEIASLRKAYLSNKDETSVCEKAEALFSTVQKKYHEQWLACVELYELTSLCSDHDTKDEIKDYLIQFAQQTPHLSEYVLDSIQLAKDLEI